MFQLTKILMYKAVIHTIHKEKDMPVCSTFEIDHDEELTFEFLKNHIEKIMKSKHMKWGVFKEGAGLVQPLEHLDGDLNSFIELTKEIAYKAQKFTHNNQESLPSCDIAFVLFECENVMYLAGIKLNHKDLLTRKLEATSNGDIAMINRSNDLYVTVKQKAEEGFIIHLKFLEIAMVDKEYNIKGEKMPFIETLLETTTDLSEKEKFKAFQAISKRIQEKFIGEDLIQKAYIKKSIVDNIIGSENASLNVQEFLEETFEDGDIKTMYQKNFEKAGILKEKIQLEQTDIKKFDKQTIVTNSGIGITVPVDYFGNDDMIEIVPNADGTINIVVKNIEEFKSN